MTQSSAGPLRLLVTGGAGYIGSHTVLALLGEGHEVTVVDNLSTGSAEAVSRVADIAGRAPRLMEADVTDAAALDAAFARARPDVVFHLAGLKSVSASLADPLAHYRQNVGGSLALLGAMDRAGCRAIVFSSSAAVYGVPARLPLDEAHPTAPASPYGRSKLMVEEMLRDWAAARGTGAVALRYFNAIGAHASGRIGEPVEAAGGNLMPAVADAALRRRAPLRVHGGDYPTRDGTAERDFVHVEDVARAHLATLRLLRRASGFEAINIGTGEGRTVLELLEAFEQATGVAVPREIGPRRDGDVPRAFTTVARAAERLGWRASRTLADGCADAWRWHMAHPRGYAAARPG